MTSGYSIRGVRAVTPREQARPRRDVPARPPAPGRAQRLLTAPERARSLPPSRVPAVTETGDGGAQEAQARLAAQREAEGGGGPAFDLSAVRIHTDTEAAAASQAMGAAAVTIGNDIYFAAGRFRPDTGPGRALIAHELTHVEQQRRDGRPRLQLSPDPPAQQKDPGSPAGGDLLLPWSDGSISLFEVTSSGIRFLVAVGPPKGKSTLADLKKTAKTAVPALAKQIADDNKRIHSPARQVKTCLIADAPSEKVQWRGAPAIVVDLAHATRETIAHEMGHATFDALADPAASDGPSAEQAAAAQDIRLRFADLFVRLGQTRTAAGQSHAAGLTMLDPAEWSGRAADAEHPWDNVGEFFASAKEGYQTNLTGLRSAIAKAAKIDPAAGQLGKELITLLDAAFGGKDMPKGDLPADRKKAAQAAPGGTAQDTKVEDLATHYGLLLWLTDPGQRPLVRKPAPPARAPSSGSAAKQP